MRPTLLEADDTVSFPPPPPPCRDLHGCARQSNSRGLEANAAAVLIVLLCGLICALALITAIRCFLRRAADHDPYDEEEARGEATKPTALVEKWKSMAPALVFTAEMKPKLAGAEAECAICLTEFTEGEEIRVLAICKHGFHVQCIQTWLILHSSCPTCRCCYLTPSAAAATPEIGLGLPEFSPIAAVVVVS